ncbi:hypothetical protein GQ42DRAFT_153849 [Ramicandelaber brevisporus]|nr:hypothetical protein GQ42DRAFT_153849 [Ramicandelaber brevisporus]
MKFAATLLAFSQSAIVVLAGTTVQPGFPVFPCPANYGSCNKCTTWYNGYEARTVALTREVCAKPFTLEACQKVYGGPGGKCDDGCNHCGCTETTVISTLMACQPYNYAHCIAKHGNTKFDCDDHTKCVCTSSGIGFLF